MDDGQFLAELEQLDRWAAPPLGARVAPVAQARVEALDEGMRPAPPTFTLAEPPEPTVADRLQQHRHVVPVVLAGFFMGGGAAAWLFHARLLRLLVG